MGPVEGRLAADAHSHVVVRSPIREYSIILSECRSLTRSRCQYDKFVFSSAAVFGMLADLGLQTPVPGSHPPRFSTQRYSTAYALRLSLYRRDLTLCVQYRSVLLGLYRRRVPHCARITTATSCEGVVDPHLHMGHHRHAHSHRDELPRCCRAAVLPRSRRKRRLSWLCPA